ncbi:hypothetical protein M9Y10_020915 [Tritrichomonas musculus]|uniref:dual-specificity kinase n=1 Tax=Tritrichomonas musculus TaxID=1915356 RepID=A0ABR2HEV9_9EUKA
MNAPLPDLNMPVTMPKGSRICTCRKSLSLAFSPIVENAPISPKEAINKYSSLLMPYEINEIQRFTEIYFLGYPNVKNSKDSYFYDKINSKDHLAYRYEIVKNLGSGSFGKVIQAIDHKTKKQVAIKILLSTEDSKAEASVLAMLNKHKCSNTIKGIDYFLFRSHACISFELLGDNLYTMQVKDNFRPIRQSVVKEYAFQIFTGLRDCAKIGIIHCDLKPENVCLCLDDSKKIKIIDFGSSCYEDKTFRSYIQSRYYRSPEVILRLKYGPKIDVWSAALVIIELLIGEPVFPGKNEFEMLNMMEELLGPVPRSMIKASRKKKYYFNEDLSMKSCPTFEPRKKKITLNTLLGPDASPQLIDFLSKCLTWKPNYRITALEALDHPWLQRKNFYYSTDSDGLPCLQK